MKNFHPSQILPWWRAFNRYPGGAWLFHRVFSRVVPYSAGIGATIVELDAGWVKTRLVDRRRIRNHLNSVHAIALCNFAEMTSGIALMTAMPLHMRGIVTSVQIRYLKKARGTLRSQCRVSFPQVEAMGVDGSMDFEVGAVIEDGDGDTVAIFTAVWRLAVVPSSGLASNQAGRTSDSQTAGSG